MADKAPVIKVSSNDENCLKFVASFCSEVKLMMNSQKVPWRIKVPTWRNILEHFFSGIF